jgi:signal transduction histidine kinase
MAANLALVGQAALAAAAVGLLGVLGVLAVSRRSATWAAGLTPLTVVLAMAAGVLTATRSMLLSSADVAAVWSVLATVAPIALAVGVLLARRTTALQRRGERERAARAAEAQVEARRREMVTWLSHDLRTPLAGIRAMTEALEDGVAPDPAAYHRRIREEAGRLSTMVDDLLSLSRLASGQLELQLAQLPLRDLISDALAGTEPLARERGVALSGACSEDVTVLADEAGMARVLRNLLINAVRYTPPDGGVRIEVVTDRCLTSVRVQDSCGGIPVDDLPRLFEAGWRGTSARTPQAATGAGLGLAVVRGLVDAMHGEIRVGNGGAGCVFELVVPAGPSPV